MKNKKTYPVISSRVARDKVEKNYKELQEIEKRITNKLYGNTNTNSG